MIVYTSTFEVLRHTLADLDPIRNSSAKKRARTGRNKPILREYALLSAVQPLDITSVIRRQPLFDAVDCSRRFLHEFSKLTLFAR